MSKKKRIDAILQIIDQYEIDTQEELTEKLVECGFDVSQATISRDINELSLIKVNGNEKKYKYSKPLNLKDVVSDKLINIFKQAVLSITSVNNLIVIKTLSGSANSSAMAIDEMKMSTILGTIAGDDTILIITKSTKDAEDLTKRLKAL